MLQLNQSILVAMVTVATPTTTPHIIATNQIDTTSFIKYNNINLINRTQILNSYANIMTQVIWYNIFLHPSIETTSIYSVMPDSMLPKS